MSTSRESTSRKAASQKGRILLILAVLFIVCIAVIVYLFIQNNNLRSENESLQKNQPSDSSAEDSSTVVPVIEDVSVYSEAYLSGNADDLTEDQLDILDMASTMTNEIFSDEMNTFEKEEAIYLYLSEHIMTEEDVTVVSATDSNVGSDIADVLKNSQGNSLGVSQLFKLLCLMQNIPCDLVANSDGTFFNIVEIDDGWYYVDLYEDIGHDLYRHFNMTEQIAALDHVWNSAEYETADSTEYAYIYINSLKPETLSGVSSMLHTSFTNKDDMVYLLCDKTSDFNEYGINAVLTEIASRVSPLLGNTSQDILILTYSWDILSLQDDYLVIIYPNYDLPSSMDEELILSINDSIYDSFGEPTTGSYSLADHEVFYSDPDGELTGTPGFVTMIGSSYCFISYDIPVGVGDRLSLDFTEATSSSLDLQVTLSDGSEISVTRKIDNVILAVG